MKLAKLNDYSRGLNARTHHDVACLTGFEFSSLPGFVDGKIGIRATYAAICGGTGVGKTALLELMFNTITGEPVDILPSPRLGSATAVIKFDHPNGTYERTCTIGNADASADHEITTSFIGLTERTSEAQRFSGEVELSVLTEGIDSYEIDDLLLGLVSIACRKKFKSIRVFETEGVGDVIIPYFVVDVAGTTYDSRSLATGELSVIYLAWAVRYIPPQSILFIEEPEAHLSPVSHLSVFELISVMCVIKKVSFFFTTHSPEIATTLAPENLICIRSEGGKSVASATVSAKLRVLARLGLVPPRVAVVFVEDELASVILKEILASFEFGVSANIEVVVTKGAGSTKKALESIPANIKSLMFLGVLDGDIEAAATTWSCKGSLLFLPFESAMETEFHETIKEHAARFSKMLDRSQEALEDALSENGGRETHDRFTGVSSDLGLSRQEVALQAFKLWKTQSGNKAKVFKFVGALAVKLGISLPVQIVL